MSTLQARLRAHIGGEKRSARMIAALDLGATKITCVILRRRGEEGSGYDLAGHGQQTSRGLKSGLVVDMQEMERSIRLAVEDAERMAGEAIRSVRVSLTGPPLGCVQARASMDIGGREITERDVQKVTASAREKSRSDTFDLLHSLPLHFSIDGTDGVRDPVGMFASKLGITLTGVTFPAPACKNLLLCVSRAHLEVESVSAAPVAAAGAVLVEDEIANGVILLDMGGGSTGIAVYQSGGLAWAGAVAIGGLHVTSDVAYGVSTTIAAAERIKTLNGTLIESTDAAREMVEAPCIGDDGKLEASRIPRAELTGFIAPRIERVVRACAGKALCIRARWPNARTGRADRRRKRADGAARVCGPSAVHAGPDGAAQTGRCAGRYLRTSGLFGGRRTAGR